MPDDVSRETDPSNYQTVDALAAELGLLGGMVAYRAGAWQDFGYPEPLPAPDSKPIPPLGERSAAAIKAGHGAVLAIDELVGKLQKLRALLVSELRQDEDIRAKRVDALLAQCQAKRERDREQGLIY